MIRSGLFLLVSNRLDQNNSNHIRLTGKQRHADSSTLELFITLSCVIIKTDVDSRL
jgi:hypothetical protein